MKNLVTTDQVTCGNVYMFELENGETNSFRVIGETPSHFILSFSKEDGSSEVFEKPKKDMIGIYDVKEWWLAQEK